jgi:signal transduction histidine kinase
VIQITGMAAGLVWQLKETDAQLGQTVERLQKIDHARALLLKNLSAAADRATKRFATELHDEALQKLTAAELELARAAAANGHGPSGASVQRAQELLGEVEEALRRLLFNVRPPSLEVDRGLEQAVRERIEHLRLKMDIAVDAELDIPNDPPYEIKMMLFRQVSEALANVEKHADPGRVRVVLKNENGGVYGAVVDDGRGFVVSERNQLPGHLGLLALNERALLAGGWNKVISEPGAGTIVEFWVPLQ